MNRKMSAILAAAALLASCGKPAPTAWESTDASGAVSASGAVPASWDGAAYVAEARGDVFKVSPAGKESPAVAGVTTLAAGEALGTRENSEASVAFPDGSVVRLAPDSRIGFSAAPSSGTDVSLSFGSLWARVIRPLGDGTAYSFRTEDLSAGIRGTSAYLSVSASGTVFEVHDSSDGAGADVSWGETRRKVAAGRRLFVPRGMGGVPAGRAASGAVSGTGGAAETAFSGSDGFSDEFRRVSLQKDIALLAKILRENRLPQGSLRKARAELDAALPADGAELGALVRDARVFERGAGTGAVAKYGPDATFSRGESSVLDAVERDLAISVIRQKYARRALRALKSLRDGSSDDAVLDAKRDMDAEIRAVLRPGKLDAGLRARLVDLTEPDPDPEETPRVRPLRDELPKRPSATGSSLPANTGSSLPAATGAKLPEKTAVSSESAPFVPLRDLLPALRTNSSEALPN